MNSNADGGGGVQASHDFRFQGVMISERKRQARHVSGDV